MDNITKVRYWFLTKVVRIKGLESLNKVQRFFVWLVILTYPKDSDFRVMYPFEWKWVKGGSL